MRTISRWGTPDLFLRRRVPESVPLKAAVIGAGVFGHHHATKYKALGQTGGDVELFAVADPSAEMRAKAKAHFPSHLWSAEDDYHWNVRSHVDKVLAGQFRVPASTIWAVYDEGIRGQWQVPPPPGASALERLIGVAGPLTATVVPLRPRQK